MLQVPWTNSATDFTQWIISFACYNFCLSIAGLLIFQMFWTIFLFTQGCKLQSAMVKVWLSSFALVGVYQGPVLEALFIWRPNQAKPHTTNFLGQIVPPSWLYGGAIPWFWNTTWALQEGNLSAKFQVLALQPLSHFSFTIRFPLDNTCRFPYDPWGMKPE